MTNGGMIIDDSPDPAVIRAAGGVLWSTLGNKPRVAVIHRPKYRDWSLPKGKLENNESWREAAVREVWEETGYAVRITSFAGTVSYVVKGRAKIVLYWNMELVGESEFVPSKEVDRLEWLSRSEAIRRLNHPAERRLLNENRGLA